MSIQKELWPKIKRPDLEINNPPLKEIPGADAVRIVLLHNGKIYLVEFGNTGWYGLPGGDPEEEKGERSGNLLGDGSLRVLHREMFEETGVDISPVIDNLYPLGLTEVMSVDNVKKTAKRTFVSIMLVRLQDENPGHRKTIKLLRNSRQIYQYDVFANPEYIHLFPDAQQAINVVRQGLLYEKYGGEAPSPHMMLPEELVYFQIQPTPKPLYNIPDWLYV